MRSTSNILGTSLLFSGGNLDVLVLVGESVRATGCEIPSEDRLLECCRLDFLVYFPPKVSAALRHVNQVADRERRVVCEVLTILLDKNVSPSLVEVAGCHRYCMDNCQFSAGFCSLFSRFRASLTLFNIGCCLNAAA